jgi:hypothetical protein
MTAPLPVPPDRPRVVDAAFWTWLAAAILLVAFGLLMATSRAEIPPFLRGFGALFVLGGLALGFLGGKMRTGHPGFRRAALALAIGLAFLLGLFSLTIRGLVWLLIMIPVLAGVALMLRPAARLWFEAEGTR